MFGLTTVSVRADFPEFGFCPLGGPGGWFNRLKNDRRNMHFFSPPYYYYPTGRYAQKRLWGYQPANTTPVFYPQYGWRP